MSKKWAKEIRKLTEEIYKNENLKVFFDTEKRIGEILCLIHSEVSEAFETDGKGMHTKSLATVIRQRLDYLESMQDYEVATDSVRCWIDQYEDDIKNNRLPDENLIDLPKSEHVLTKPNHLDYKFKDNNGNIKWKSLQDMFRYEDDWNRWYKNTCK